MRYQVEPGESVSHAVTRAVSDFEGCDVKSLPPLQDSIDVDAINLIFDRASGSAPHLLFDYTGVSVSIDSDDSIVVKDATGGGRN